MLRRLSISAALAALAVPVVATGLLAGPAAADDSGMSDPAVQTQIRKTERRTAERPPVVSRRANRAPVRAETDAPLTVTIDQLTPSTIPEKGVIRVSGTVTNNDKVPWTTINVRPFISAEPMTTAAQLAEAADTPPDAVVGERINDERHKDFIEELAPGEQQSYSFSVPRNLLRADSAGVYWFGVHALGENGNGRDETADGRARTFLPLVPASRPGELPTTLVIPLRHQLTYSDDGSLDDLADWTKTLSQGGRLRALVDFGASSGDRSVTWVVDPALVDAVRRLAEGNPPRSLAANLQAGEPDGESDETTDPSTSPSTTPSATPTETPSPSEESEQSGDGPLDLDALDPVVQAAADAAQAWLARLGSAMQPEDQVMTLPYGDVDVAGAAEHDPALYHRAVERAGSGLAGFDVPTTLVLSSPSGYLSTQGLALADPGTAILLTDAMFEDPAPALAATDGHRVVVTSTGAAEGGPGPDARMGLTAMRQRLLAEAAVRFLGDDHTSLAMVLPHDWKPDGGATYFGGLDVPWLDLTTVDAVSSATAPSTVTGSTLRYPKWQAAAQIGQSGFDAADDLTGAGATLQSLLTLNNVIAGTVADQALGSVSYSARTRPITNRQSAEGSQLWIEERLRRVRVSAPRAVTLSSSSGRFQATITNGLDEPVTVSLDAQSDDRLAIDGPRRVEVRPQSQVAVILTARTDENGLHEVTLFVTDKRGTALGARTGLTVRSAQVSNVIWLFMAIGAALLFGAILIRLFRRVRNARRAGSGNDDPAGDGSGGDAADPPAEDRQPAGAGSR
ncbi:DUF6049 family protein [uncultured Nocardioides sp.]|uniref:DUF6049 family protein n=1 Tax=uncultured Nocardioides sp. TaxID=198441 RepID=UPI00262A3FC5|nr:DUF6049 family protein [uncultured Nocardioides sp.]HRD61247.1 DUF6049 family protein [Nocardioides sp.]